MFTITTRLPVPTLFCFVLLASTPATAGFSEECPFGVNAHQVSDSELDLAAAAGIGWVRMDFNWNQIEVSRGTYDWSMPDRFVAAAENLGLNVFATVAQTPSWAVAGGCDDNASESTRWCRNAVPDDPTTWTDFVSAAVGRYNGRISHWGMWNEPNLEHFFLGTREEYVDLILVPGSAAVHATCADCLVLGPELAHLRGADHWSGDEGICAFGECIFNGWEVSLSEVLRDAESSIDIITHHNYEDSSSALWGELTDGEFLAIQYMHGVKEITDLYAPGKPVWLTEFGYETNPGGDFTETEAALELEQTFEALFDVQAGSSPWVANQPWPELEKLFWYDLTDDPNTYEWGTFTWGLLTADLAPKEAWYAYGDLIAARGDCWEETDPESGDTGSESGTSPGDTGAAPQDTEAADTGSDANDSESSGGSDTDTSPNDRSGCACSANRGPFGGGLSHLLLLLGICGGRRFTRE